jgi:hypothetical protein
MATASPLYQQVLKTFRTQKWAFREVKEQLVVESEFEAFQSKILLHVQVYPNTWVASVVAQVPREVPRSHRLAVCELIMRTNQELNVGNFELMWDEGKVLFRLTNLFAKDGHCEDLITGMIHTAVAEADRFIGFLAEVVNCPKLELAFLKIPQLMRREDLLPQPPAEMI